ncbi:hypothetical protein PLESTB_001467700 [Pleodorina starrii]|uniref:YTH domain-containing protein n=1 Tax=Pleodorina starrii TaxID=330485 RepID=A0A9W6F7F0_9CHLO|nr:hypothetical protein PLESTM_001686000 [Pleodorina starrii]GLC59262.1 hypothetical protein PLESTB_001467700 [Pleodorina starrii]GLC74827.1 hypothetical protein PLESTF_001560300 [Pleodorina starrii]
MDEEALLYEDDYEPELDPEPVDDGQQEATPAAGEAAEEPSSREPVAKGSKGEGPVATASRGEETAGPSGRGAVNGPSKTRRGRGPNQEGRGSNQGIRYFIIRSSTLQNIFISVRVGAWATTRQNDDKLDEAFRKSREVRLLYSVNGSNAFQGYAVMRTPVGKFGRPVVWENGKQFGNPFGVEWRVLVELPHSEIDHIRNPYNDNKPVRLARDGTELPQEQGDVLVRLMQDRAAATGVKPPRQQLALMDAGGRSAPGQSLPGRGGGMPMAGPGRLGPGGHGAGMGPGMRPVGGPGMGPAAMMAMGGLVPGLMGPMAGMGGSMAGGMGPGPNLEQIAAAMAMGNVTPAALNSMLQQAGMGMQPGVGALQQPDLQALAAAMVAQMASLLPDQQAMAMSVITASNPLLAEAMAAVINSRGAGGVGPARLNAAAAVPRGGPVGMGMGNAALSGGVMPGPGGGMPGQGGLGPHGGAHRVGGALIRGVRDESGHVGAGPGEPRMFASQQQHMQQVQQQQAQQQFMNFNRDEVVLEGSDGRLRSGRSRSRSRSRSPVHVRRSGGPVDFNSMTYEQYLQQYGRVQDEVSRRVGSGSGQHRGRSAEHSPGHAREPTPASQGGMGYGRVGSGGGDGAMAGGGGAGSGMAAKPGGQPYTEEEYIRVTLMMYASRGQPAPSEAYIRQHYRQMLAQLQQQR